jgi:site-specific DNA recombinase
MNAVIYCRVSSKEQVEGTSLESQESACREYARKHNLHVLRVFVEEGESAKAADRTHLLELLTYCKNKSRKVGALLVWKLDRFARNVEDHYRIKATLAQSGVRVVSVTEPIQADANGKLMETILAGFAQFDNDIRSLRSIQGMQQRIREGLWPWKPPLGYLPPKTGKKTTPDTPDPQCFESIQSAWKLLASGTSTKADVLRLLHRWGIRAYRGRLPKPQLLDHMFSNPYYAGILRDPWTGKEYRGRHEPMISDIEFARVQTAIAGRSTSRPHHRVVLDFPLRGCVRCPSCESYMTGYFAQGKRLRYAYYKCFRRECATLGKSYPASEVHAEFLDWIRHRSVPPYLAAALITEAIKASWEEREDIAQGQQRRQEEVERVKRQLQELIAMRAQQLVTDDEFTIQRNTIRRQMYDLDGSATDEDACQFTDVDVRLITAGLSDLRDTWSNAPIAARRALNELFLPRGYVLHGIAEADSSILLRSASPQVPPADVDVRIPANLGVFEHTHEGRPSEFNIVRTPQESRRYTLSDAFSTANPHVAAHVRQNLNTLICEIRKLLTILRPVDSPEEKAA